MKYCLHPSHSEPGAPSPWELDGQSHDHGKPRMRFVDGEWRDIDYLLSEGLREALRESK